jgi:hypothetical protein
MDTVRNMKGTTTLCERAKNRQRRRGAERERRLLLSNCVCLRV